MENANINLPISCRCSSFANSRYPLFFMYITNTAINAMPDTQLLANVYQLYMVLYQCASILISHSQGTVDITVNANHTMKIAAHTVFFQMNFLPASVSCNGFSSSERESLRIL